MIRDWLSKNRVLVALLVLAAMMSALWSVAMPPWRAPDEPHHFGYIQYMAREQSVPLGGRVDHYPDLLQSLNRTNLGIAMGQEGAYWDPDARDPNNAAGHPPLYYSLMLPAYGISSGGSIETQLYVLRICGAAIFMMLVAVSYQLARRVFPRARYFQIGVPLLIILHPQLGMVSASVNNDALLALLFTWFLYQLVVFAQGDFSYRRASLIGVAIGLGMLTKSSFMLAYLIALAVFGSLLFIKSGQRERLAKAAGTALGLSVLICGWFYLRNYIELGEAQSYARTAVYGTDNPWTLWTATSFRSQVIASFIGNFSWLTVPITHDGLYWFRRISQFAFFGLVAGLGLGWWRRNLQAIKPWILFLMAGSIALFLLSITFFELRIGGAQGRYLFPAIFPFWALFLVGITGWLPRSWRARATAVVVSLAALFSTWALMAEFIPRVT